jgi:hypothetical protein
MGRINCRTFEFMDLPAKCCVWQNDSILISTVYFINGFFDWRKELERRSVPYKIEAFHPVESVNVFPVINLSPFKGED